MRLSKPAAAERILILILCITFFQILSGKIHEGKSNAPDQVTEISDGWYYVKDGVKIPVTLPASITLDSGEDLVLYCDVLTEENAHQILTTRGAVYHLKVSAGSQVLYQYDDSSFPRNDQMASKVNCTATLPGNYKGETIAFTYENTHNGVFRIGKICIGAADAVFFYHCYKDSFTLITILVMTVLGILSVCISLYLKHMQVGEKRFADIACFLLFCVCWFLTDSSMAQMIGGSSPVIRYISFYAFMLLAIPMLHFIKNTESMKNCRVIDIIICIFYANALIQSTLNYLGIFDFIDMLFVTHLLLFGGICVLLTLLIRTYRKSGDKELYTILWSFIVVAGGGIVSLILYWLLKISYYEVFFECGIIILIILLIRVLIITMVQNLKFRTETMVYQRLAKEDPLTGMKNRRAFDEAIAKIEENTCTYDNLYLVFMDLNRLKNINDTLGHHVGDELIVAAARCIEKAYGADGSCFRIGGDEFCALVPNTELSVKDLSDRLDEEIRLYNNICSRYQISISKGISNLRSSDGTMKSVSDWKEEADLKMYENKGWIKRIE